MLRILSLAVPAFLLAFAVACGGDDTEIPPQATPTATPLPARPDGRLTMCIEAIHGAEGYQAQAVQRVGEALAGVRQDGRWLGLFPSSAEPVLDSGCPEDPALPAANRVETPGFYQVFLFVVPADQSAMRFSQEIARTSTGGGVETAAGLFVTTGDLCDSARLVLMLKSATGFDHSPMPTTTSRPEGPTVTPCF